MEVGRERYIVNGPRCLSETLFIFSVGNGKPSEVSVQGSNVTRTVVSKDNWWQEKHSKRERPEQRDQFGDSGQITGQM